jgi:hypothetical protein
MRGWRAVDLAHLNEVTDGSNHTTQGAAVFVLDAVAEPSETERLNRALLVVLVANGALAPGDS